MKTHTSNRIFNNLTSNKGGLHNYQKATNERVCILWNSQWYDVILIEKEAQFIHCLVKGRIDGSEFVVIIIDDYNSSEQRKSMQANLQ